MADLNVKHEAEKLLEGIRQVLPCPRKGKMFLDQLYPKHNP